MIKNLTKTVSCLIDPKTRKVISAEGDLETVHREIKELKWAIKALEGDDTKWDRDNPLSKDEMDIVCTSKTRLKYLRKLSARMLATQYQSDKREKQREVWKAQKEQIGDVVPTGMCVWAFYTLFPFVSGLQSGGSFPWEKDSDKTNVACPDAENPVVFELRKFK